MFYKRGVIHLKNTLLKIKDGPEINSSPYTHAVGLSSEDEFE